MHVGDRLLELRLVVPMLAAMSYTCGTPAPAPAPAPVMRARADRPLPMYSGPPPCFRGKLSPTTRVEEIDPSRAGRYVDVGYFLLPDSQLDAHARFAEAARAAGCEAIVVEQHVEDWGDRSGEFGVRRFPELLAKCLVRAASCE